MKGPWTAGVALAFLLTAGAAGDQPVLAQASAPPVDVSAAIAAAIETGEAAASAGESASIADNEAWTDITDGRRTRVQEAALVEAVVSGIAQHPDAVSAIVRAAVERAPAHRSAVARRASIAFPGFALQIAAAAGVPQAPPVPAYVPPTAAPLAPPAPPVPTDVRQAGASTSQTSQSRPMSEALAGARPSPVAASRKAPQGDGKDPSLYDLDYPKSYLLNSARLIGSPWRFEPSDWINAAVVLGVAGGLVALDSSIRDFVREDTRSDTTDDLSDIFREFGDTQTMALALGAAYLGGEFAGDRRLQETALLGTESFVLAGLLAGGIKSITQRKRPNTGSSSTSWDPFSFSETGTSFPSAHAIRAFAVASVIGSEYQDGFLIPAMAYGVATLTALSRVNDDEHWMSDVFVGSAIGYFVGKMVVRYDPFKKDKRLAVRPFLTHNGPGLSVAYKL